MDWTILAFLNLTFQQKSYRLKKGTKSLITHFFQWRREEVSFPAYVGAQCRWNRQYEIQWNGHSDFFSFDIFHGSEA